MKHGAKHFRLIVVLALFCPVSGAAAPWQRHTIDPSDKAAGRRGADGVRLADINGDGRLDVATGWEEGGTIGVCVNPGKANAKQPWPTVVVGRVKSPEDAVFVDLDGDGAMDVVSCCEGGTRRVFAHWSPKDPAAMMDRDAWRTEAFGDAPAGQQWMFACPASIGGAGDDLVIGSKGNAVVGWLEQPKAIGVRRDAKAWKYHPICKAGWIMSIVTSDMDGDGDVDVIISDRKGKQAGVWWLENPAIDPPSADSINEGDHWRRHLIGGKGMEVMFLDLVDFDGDGSADVIVATRNGVILLLLCSEGNAGLVWVEQKIANPAGVRNGKAVRAGDIDGDGDLDLAHTTNTSGLGGEAGPPPAVTWLENLGEGKNWRTHAVSDDKGKKFDLIELVDLDGDGDLDLMTCEERDNLGVIWYENPAGRAESGNPKAE